MPRFTLRQLEIFTMVAQTRNVTRAGDLLHLSPSATSAAISELERALGSTLCTRRKGRGVELTAEGRLFQEQAAQLLDQAVEMGNSLAEYSSGSLKGTLRIGFHATVSASYLPKLMDGFITRFPDVELELVCGEDDDLHGQMLNGQVDVCLGYQRSEHRDLQSIHVRARRPYVIVGGEHRFAHRTRISLADLVDDPLIVVSIGRNEITALRWFAEFDLKPNVRWVTQDIELTRALVGRGLGYAVLLQRHHHPYTVEAREVRTLELSPAPTPLDVYLTVSNSALTARRVREFVRMAREMFRLMPVWGAGSPPDNTPAPGN